MAGDLSPFAALSAFASASPPHSDEPSPGSGQGSSSLSRLGSRTVGFHEPPAVALEPSPKPAACPLAARQHSMGSLGQLLRAAQAEQARPRLTISTARSLKAPASGRGRRVLRIAEHEEGPAGGSSSDLLGSTAPSHAAPAGMSMHRSSSIDIGPSRCGGNVGRHVRLGLGAACRSSAHPRAIPCCMHACCATPNQGKGVQGSSSCRRSRARAVAACRRTAAHASTCLHSPAAGCPFFAGCARPGQPQRRYPTRSSWQPSMPAT